jgi:hypothetical protein
VVVYSGLGCTEARAAAVVDRLERDAEGALTALDVTVEHYCAGSGDKGLHAQVRYRA